MRNLVLGLATAASAVLVATPATAQYYPRGYGYSRDYGARYNSYGQFAPCSGASTTLNGHSMAFHRRLPTSLAPKPTRSSVSCASHRETASIRTRRMSWMSQSASWNSANSRSAEIVDTATTTTHTTDVGNAVTATATTIKLAQGTARDAFTRRFHYFRSRSGIFAPPSGASSAQIDPPWASATCRAKLRPTPLPPLWVV